MAGQLDGFYDAPPLPFEHMGLGAFTPFGSILAPGGAVLFVRGNGSAITEYAWDPPGLRERLNASVAVALRQCVNGRGDRIIVLEGHTENVATADAWAFKTGVKVIGVGEGDNRPTISWTTDTSTVLMNDANVTLSNLIMNFDTGTATVTVAAPITVSAAGCAILGCRIRNGTDADSNVTIGVTTTAGATRFKFIGNKVRGALDALSTTFLRLVGCDDVEVAYNDIRCASSSAAVGVIQALTTAPTNLNVHHNYIENNKADSTAALTFMANATGCSRFNDLRIYGTGTAYVTTPGSVAFYETRGVNAIADGTAEKPTADFGTASA